MSYSRPKIRILFVEARYIDSFRLPTDENLSLYMLATFLKDNLPEIDFEFDFAQTHNYLSYVSNNSFDLCGVYSTTQAWSKACEIAAKMRSLGVIAVVGGPHITCIPESLSRDFAAGCIGPGELVLKELVEIYLENGKLPISELSKVDGIAFYGLDGLQVKNPPLKNIPLDNLQSPYKYYLKPNKIRTNLLSSMGCPHSCFFCSAKVINPILRMYSARHIVEEIKYLHDNHEISSFKFMDDNLLASRKRLEDMVRLLEAESLLNKIKISCTSSSKFINEDTAKMLKLLNCEFVAIGFESGSAHVLEKLKLSHISIEDHERALKLLNDQGIKISGTFILGTPGESVEDMNKTLKFIKRNKIHNISAYFIKPLPGTPFWKELVAMGKIQPDAVNFQELALTNYNEKWYFNDRVPYAQTVRYLKLINCIGLYRTIKQNLTNKLLYQAGYRQLQILGYYFKNKVLSNNDVVF